MRIGMLTREWPPEIYGGAGVHVDQLVAQLRHLAEVDVHCFGARARTPWLTPYPIFWRERTQHSRF